ncbi:MAG TPA: tetratricopeptide repeat protein [Pyrinomonadaceae bacterium]|nr:tetratricopeptide repeat protein [Pyrinomonadaceae bacterium]
MSRDNFLFAIIGVLLGFIIGFMLHGVMSQRDAERASTQQRQPLPPDHPPVGTDGTGPDQQQSMQQVQQTIQRARSDPKDFDAQIMAANLEYQIGQYDEAIKFLITANQIKPDHYGTIATLGMVNMDAGHLDAAEKWYRAALAKDPNDVSVLDGLSNVLLKAGKAGPAEEMINRLAKADPTNEDLTQFRTRLAELKKK